MGRPGQVARTSPMAVAGHLIGISSSSLKPLVNVWSSPTTTEYRQEYSTDQAPWTRTATGHETKAAQPQSAQSEAPCLDPGECGSRRFRTSAGGRS